MKQSVHQNAEEKHWHDHDFGQNPLLNKSVDPIFKSRETSDENGCSPLFCILWRNISDNKGSRCDTNDPIDCVTRTCPITFPSRKRRVLMDIIPPYIQANTHPHSYSGMKILEWKIPRWDLVRMRRALPLTPNRFESSEKILRRASLFFQRQTYLWNTIIW